MFPLANDFMHGGGETSSSPGGRRVERSLAGAASALGLTFALLLLVALSVPAFAQEAEAVAERFGEQEQLELDHLLEDLRDTRLDLDRRRRAAQILLTREWPEATGALRLDLVRDADVGTQRAIAQAIAAVDLPDPELMQPLMNLLAADDAELRRDVAAALGRFDDEQLMEHLMQLAREGGESQAERLGAIDALAQHRRPEVVELLLQIADADATDEPWAVRAAAFDALARLTGLHTLENDAEAWREWWSRASELSPRQWQAGLLQNLSNRNAHLAKQVQVTRDRLVSAHNRLYDATDESGRSAMLQQMLDDPMEDLRLLALRLIERRVLNAQPVSDAVRQSMRQRLADRSADVRIKSASVLETLADAEAAELAVNLLFTERSREVQAAYLTLMARVPSGDAVEPALWLMQEERVASAAADCLTAAFDANLMSERQVARAREAVRRHITTADGPDRAMLRLLARVGEEEDLPTLTEQLQHSDGAVRLTAARGFGQPQWPLEPLLAVIGDATLRPAVIEVAESRGQTLSTLEHLLSNEPAADENGVADAWREALAAIAARLDADAVAQLDQRLTEMDRPALHQQVLAGAAALDSDAWSANSLPAARIEAALRLARLHVAQAQLAEAERAYAALLGRNGALSADQKQRLGLGRTALLLEQGDVEQASELNRDLLDRQIATADQLVEVWLEVAERAVNGSAGEDAAAGDRDAARLVVETAADLFEDDATEGVRERLGALREQLQAPPAAAAAEDA